MLSVTNPDIVCLKWKSGVNYVTVPNRLWCNWKRRTCRQSWFLRILMWVRERLLENESKNSPKTARIKFEFPNSFLWSSWNSYLKNLFPLSSTTFSCNSPVAAVCVHISLHLFQVYIEVYRVDEDQKRMLYRSEVAKQTKLTWRPFTVQSDDLYGTDGMEWVTDLMLALLFQTADIYMRSCWNSFIMTVVLSAVKSK